MVLEIKLAGAMMSYRGTGFSYHGSSGSLFKLRLMVQRSISNIEPLCVGPPLIAHFWLVQEALSITLIGASYNFPSASQQL